MSGTDFSDPSVIAALAAALEAAGVDGIEIERGAQKVRIVVDHGGSTRTAGVTTSHQGQSAGQSATITAPAAGIFASRHPAASATAQWELPRDVASGDVSGFIRIGPVLLAVKAPASGTLKQVLAADGALVGYGDPLFEIETRP